MVYGSNIHLAFAGSAPKVPTGAYSNYDGTFNVEYADGTSIYAYTGTDDSAVAVNCPGELVFSRYFIETNPDEPNPPRFMYRYREADVMTNEFTMFLDWDCSWVYPIQANYNTKYYELMVTYSDTSFSYYPINLADSELEIPAVCGPGIVDTVDGGIHSNNFSYTEKGQTVYFTYIGGSN